MPDNLRLCPDCAIPKHSKASSSLAPARGSVLDRAPMTITAYLCVKCDRFHRKPGRKFQECYAANEKHYGWTPAPNDQAQARRDKH